MKKFKFRGKGLETNQWVYGSLIADYQENLFFIKDEKFQTIPIHPSSVGQFSGLIIDEKEAYEGDILCDFDEAPLYIKFSEEKAAFCFVDEFDSYGTEYYTVKDLAYEGFEIVGNLFDDAQLLRQYEAKISR